tara:strand:+ start:427 stop:588 length:162 start_codon:yes stop_codon:yes gene_type:complete
MKNLLLLFVLILSSCSTNLVKNDLDFSNDMSFDEFKIKLKVYANNNPFPNIDK